MPPKPLLVTGSHRSGTTWVGEALAGSPDYAFVYEPFNPRITPNWLRHPLSRPYLYATAANEHEHPHLRDDLAAVMRLRYPFVHLMREGRLRGANGNASFARSCLRSGVVGRLHRASPLIKDPLALMSAPWIADTFGAEVLVTVRHPGAFAASLIDKGWRFDFADFVGQRSLMDGPFAPFADELVAAQRDPGSLPAQAALIFKVLYSFVRDELDPRPDCTIVRHEDVVADPAGVFANLFEKYGARPAETVTTRLPSATFTSSDRPAADFTSRWHTKLDPSDILSIQQILGDSADWLYDRDTWPVRDESPPT